MQARSLEQGDLGQQGYKLVGSSCNAGVDVSWGAKTPVGVTSQMAERREGSGAQEYFEKKVTAAR